MRVYMRSKVNSEEIYFHLLLKGLERHLDYLLVIHFKISSQRGRKTGLLEKAYKSFSCSKDEV